MEIINLKSSVITALKDVRSKGYNDVVTIKKCDMYFNKSFCVTYGLKSGQRMNFINDGREWKFYVDDDPDGFKLVDDQRKNGALRIFCAALCHLIRRSTGFSEDTLTFKIQATTIEHKNRKVFQIIMSKNLA